MRTYSHPKRENDPYALSDVEVFYMSAAAIDSVFIDNGIDPTDDRAREDSEIGYSGPGWYYWYCFPGCMPDSDPSGPFTTADEAIEDMRENSGNEDDEDDDDPAVLAGPITEGQPGQLGPSVYVSQGYDAGSGLYVFLNEDGQREYFAKRTDTIAGWGLDRNGIAFEFVRSEVSK